jgi:hypothetical protein
VRDKTWKSDIVWGKFCERWEEQETEREVKSRCRRDGWDLEQLPDILMEGREVLVTMGGGMKNRLTYSEVRDELRSLAMKRQKLAKCLLDDFFNFPTATEIQGKRGSETGHQSRKRRKQGALSGPVFLRRRMKWIEFWRGLFPLIIFVVVVLVVEMSCSLCEMKNDWWTKNIHSIFLIEIEKILIWIHSQQIVPKEGRQLKIDFGLCWWGCVTPKVTVSP